MHTVYNNISRWDVVENKSAKLFVLVKYTTSTETRVVAAKFFFLCVTNGDVKYTLAVS
jgi:hypothetical protein